jgi:hypothetical protein
MKNGKERKKEKGREGKKWEKDANQLLLYESLVKEIRLKRNK